MPPLDGAEACSRNGILGDRIALPVTWNGDVFVLRVQYRSTSLNRPFAMSRVFSALLLTSLAVLIGAQTALAQDRVRESRTVAAFTEVGFSVPGTVHLRQGDTHSVAVEAPQRVLDHLETTVEDDRPKIRDESNFFESMFDGSIEAVDVYVTVPTIETVSLAGSGTVVGETPIENPSLSLENAGSGTIDLEASTSDLQIGIAGSGTLRLRGTADDVEVKIAGSGTVRALDLTTKTADVQVTGSGDTRLHATEELAVKIMGSGDVVYRGSPSIDTSILGSGEVRSAE